MHQRQDKPMGDKRVPKNAFKSRGMLPMRSSPLPSYGSTNDYTSCQNDGGVTSRDSPLSYEQHRHFETNSERSIGDGIGSRASTFSKNSTESD